MTSHALRPRVLPAAILVIVASAFLPAGCASDLPQLQQARDAATATLAQARAVDASLRQQAATRPADDPLHAQVDQLESVIAKVQAILPTINAAIASINAGGTVDPAVQQAAGAIPYGSIALAVASLVFALVKHVQAGNLASQQQQAQKAFEQVVAAMDAALPAPTPEQQAKVQAVLDTDVKAKVAAARA